MPNKETPPKIVSGSFYALIKMIIWDILIANFTGKLIWKKATRYGKKVAQEKAINEKDVEKLIHEFRKNKI